jgi:hypothetical protein
MLGFTVERHLLRGSFHGHFNGDRGTPGVLHFNLCTREGQYYIPTIFTVRLHKWHCINEKLVTSVNVNLIIHNLFKKCHDFSCERQVRNNQNHEIQPFWQFNKILHV